MYHFISGYTAKVAGTEAGITEPKATFSNCFGAPFLPLHPTFYAAMLGKRIDKYQPKIWLVNTGWTGGPYGTGSRIKLAYTRALITAVMNGSLNQAGYEKHELFGLEYPTSCEGVPAEILNPKTPGQIKMPMIRKRINWQNCLSIILKSIKQKPAQKCLKRHQDYCLMLSIRPASILYYV